MPNIKTLQQHKMVLDTHVWLWLAEKNPCLSKSFINAVDKSQTLDGILISPISIWEIGMLVEKGRVQLEMDVLDWIEQSLKWPGMRLVAISPRIAIQSTRLPGIIHGDHADRLLAASAYEENAVLVTADQKLLDYGKGRFISVHNPLQKTL